MKKISQLLMVFVLMFFAFGTGTAKADEYLASELLKQQANQYCGFVSLVNTPDETIQEEIIQDETIQEEIIQDEMIQDEMIQEEIIQDETIQTQSGFSNQTATSKAGSKIILPSVPYVKYGYCHIFRDHMEKSNGTLNNKIGSKTQFKYAYGPEKTMKIAMEVINLQPDKEPDGDDRYTKEIKSPTAGQVVRVVIHRTRSFAGGVYSGHDYVIVSMYPVF